MESERSLDERSLVLGPGRVGEAALDGADRLAGLVIVEADALGAEIRIDDVNLVPFADRVVGAFGLAGTAVDAVGGDVRGHRSIIALFEQGFRPGLNVAASTRGLGGPCQTLRPADVEVRSFPAAASLRDGRSRRTVRARSLGPMIARVLLSATFLALAALAIGCAPKIGDECSSSSDCSVQADRLCDTTLPGGYCTIFNCEPGTCPEDESVCVAFNGSVCEDPLRTPRFQRTFCMARCDDDGDCRSGYACIDMGDAVVDIDPPTRKVCVVRPEAASEPEGGERGVCEAPGDADFPTPEPIPTPGPSEAGTDAEGDDGG